MERWRGRTALVTGASSGIGYKVAEDLSKAGVTVIACARNIATIEELGKKVTSGQGKIYAIKCDLTKESEILDMFRTIEQKFKYVDILINNAGMSHPEDLLTGRTDRWKFMIDLNVLALSICTREALRLMEKNKVDDGHVVNINSIAGHETHPNFPIIHFYMATKHMVTALTKALNAELRQKKTKIRVTDISPGAVSTEFQNTLTADSPDMRAAFHSIVNYKFLTPGDISQAVLYVIGAPAHVNVQEIILVPTDQPAT